jgi:hypothetical protein
VGKVTVRVGFVPSYRFRCTPRCRKMRSDSPTAFSRIAGLEVVVPEPATDGVSVNAQLGHTPDRMVATLEQAEAVADYFAGRKVDALILCPLDFGDERSAAKVAERLRVPVLLYATREPLPRTSRAWGASLIRTGSWPGIAETHQAALPTIRPGRPFDHAPT